MEAKWLIEAFCLEENHEALLDSLKNHGIMYRSLDEDESHDLKEEVLKSGKLMVGLPANEFRSLNKKYLGFFEPDDCVVVRGSIQFCNMVRKEAPWIPGVYCNWPAFECINYYPKFREHLLNGEEYMILPYGDLKRQKEFIYKTFGQADTIFIRPNSGNKIFTGEAIQKERFEQTIDYLGYSDVPENELCIITYPVNLVAEYRFIVAKQEVIAGSEYRPERFELNPLGAVWDYACEVIEGLDYQPDRVWSLDICKTKAGRLKVLEIGSFSCAGLYKCNTDTVVREVSRVALEEWEEYQPTA